MRKVFLAFCAGLMISTLLASAQTPTQMPTGPEARFFIQSAMNYGKNNGGYWDVPGVFQPNMSIPRGSNIQVYDLDVHHDRQFTLYKSSVDGYYEIQVGLTNETRVDIKGANFAATPNGCSAQTWDRNSLTNQQFLFQHLGNGRFKIYDRCSGKVICLANRSSANRSNVHVWDDHNGPWMEWYLIDVNTKKAFIPGPIIITSTPPQTSGYSTIFSLEPNETLVYGKVGLNDNGTVKYTFAMTRTPNKSKQIYRREIGMPYTHQPVLRGGQMSVDNNPPDYDMYDYSVIFNKLKLGPYDRIYDMHQKEGDIEKWITPDGKHISFAGVKGQQYFPVFGNTQGQIAFWSVLQAPNFDSKSNRNTFVMQWGPSDFRLFENGTQKLTGWRNIKNVTYADNNRDLIYVGAPTNPNEFYVYLNHSQIGGPFTAVTQVGFLSGINKPYYRATKVVTVNNTRQEEREFLIGDRKLNFTHEQQVGQLEIADPWVVFTVFKKNMDYTGNEDYKKGSLEIWEYNFRSGELLKHGGYGGYFNIIQTIGKSIYYSLMNPQGDYLIVSKGGKVIYKGTGITRYNVSPNGDIYTYAKASEKSPYTLKKNGEPFTIPGVDKIMRVEILEFNQKNGELNLVVAKDQLVGSEDRTVINGSNRFDIKGRAYGGDMFFAENGTDVISLVEFKRGDDMQFTIQIYKNGKPESNLLFKSVREFTISPDATRYAALVTGVDEDFESVPYFTENQYMNIKRKLMVDGKIIEGNFGAPIWYEAKKKFLVIKQVGRQLQLVEL